MNEKEKVLISKYHAIKKKKRRRKLLFFILLLVIGSSVFIVMNVMSSSGKKKAVVVEEVKDTKKPTLELNASEIEIVQGSSIAYETYIKSASDEVYGDLKKAVTYNEIDTNTIGSYRVTYKVKDKAGNEATAFLNVKVIEEKKEEPVQEETKQQSENETTTPQQEQNTSPAPQEDNTQVVEIPSSASPKFYSVSEYGSIDGAMNACYGYIDINGGSCKPVRSAQNGEWQGYQYTP